MLFDRTIDLNDFRGVLDLQLDLSTTHHSENEEEDTSLVPLALAIVKRISTAGQPPDYRERLRVLPGAPYAFVRRAADHYLDTSHLLAWTETYGDFPWETRNAVAKYFGDSGDKSRPRVRSFFSLVISPIQIDPTVADEPCSVVNLYSDRPGLLGEKEAALKQFVPVIQPIVAELYEVLQIVTEKRALACSP